MLQCLTETFARYGPQGVEMACHVQEIHDLPFRVLEHLGLPDEWLNSEDAAKVLFVQSD
jgi:hypothetical protein